MFTAYFDASGTKGTRVMTVAGFVSRVQKWGRFESAWTSLLPSTVTRFRMTDFVSSKNGWEDWKGDSERRVRFFRSLISCIKSHTNKGFAASVQMKDYNDFDRLYMFREQVGPPYAFLGIACLGRLRVWAENKRIDWRKIICAFEDGDEGQADLMTRARKAEYNAIPQSKAAIRAFDSCDLAAWKARAVIDDSWGRNLHLADPDAADRIMRSLAQIELVLQDNGMYSPESLGKICHELKIARRLK